MNTSQVPATAGSNVRTWTVLCHLTALFGFFFHFVGFVLGPLIVWLVKRGDSPEIDAHGKESVNFQLTMLIYSVISGILFLLLIGFVLLAFLHVFIVVFVIIASIGPSEERFNGFLLTFGFWI